MASGCDCVAGTYGIAEDETTVGSILKAIHDIIVAHDATKCHVIIVSVDGPSRATPQVMAVVYWED